MKIFLKILKDESGRQIEGMILIAIAGIIVAIAVPQIERFFGLSIWLSLLIAIAGVFGLFVVIIVIPNLIRESHERNRDGIHHWNLETGETVLDLGVDYTVYSLAFSPDGRFLATAGDDGIIHIWEITTGEELMMLKGHKGAIQTVTFSPDGKLLASGGSDCTIRIWDVASRNLRMNLKGNLGTINAVAFSPDGRVLASGSETPW